MHCTVHAAATAPRPTHPGCPAVRSPCGRTGCTLCRCRGGSSRGSKIAAGDATQRQRLVAAGARDAYSSCDMARARGVAAGAIVAVCFLDFTSIPSENAGIAASSNSDDDACTPCRFHCCQLGCAQRAMPKTRKSCPSSSTRPGRRRGWMQSEHINQRSTPSLYPLRVTQFALP